MSTVEFTKKYYFKTEISVIQNILTDMQLFGKLHPLIKSVTKLENDSSLFKKYRITERPYNLIPVNIQYSVELESNENKIIYRIEYIPFTKAQITYQLVELKKQNIEVVFHLKIDGILIANKILMNKMVAAQDQLMNEIEKELVI